MRLLSKAKGADSLSRSRPLDPISEDPVRSPNHNFVFAKFFEPRKLRGSLSLPFHIRCESFVSAPFVAVQLPVGAASLVADTPGGRSPLSSWKIALPLS